LSIGADLTYVGVATLDGTHRTPVGTDGAGNSIFEVVLPQGFFLVVEAKRGPSGRPVGTNVFNHNPMDPNARPDLQIQANRPLGPTPTTRVCDKGPAPAPVGGVPGINPASFALTQLVSDAFNDFSCRFIANTNPELACTGAGGAFFFVNGTTTTQFCGLMGSEMAFPRGDTIVTVRVRDNIGQPGLPKSIVIRVP
jgi:hypothetical protein